MVNVLIYQPRHDSVKLNKGLVPNMAFYMLTAALRLMRTRYTMSAASKCCGQARVVGGQFSQGLGQGTVGTLNSPVNLWMVWCGDALVEPVID